MTARAAQVVCTSLLPFPEFQLWQRWMLWMQEVTSEAYPLKATSVMKNELGDSHKNAHCKPTPVAKLKLESSRTWVVEKDQGDREGFLFRKSLWNPRSRVAKVLRYAFLMVVLLHWTCERGCVPVLGVHACIPVQGAQETHNAMPCLRPRGNILNAYQYRPIDL
jgi:hypothetical protein